MDISRRALIGGVAAIPAAAVVVAAMPSAAATSPAEMIIASIEPIEFPYRYWVGDGERFGCDFDTLEEAMRFAVSEESPVVLRARQFEVPWKVYETDVEAMLGHMHEWVNDEYGDSDWNCDEVMLDYTPEQRDELVREIGAVFDAWRARHGLRNTALRFDHEGMQEYRVSVSPVPTVTIQASEG